VTTITYYTSYTTVTYYTFTPVDFSAITTVSNYHTLPVSVSCRELPRTLRVWLLPRTACLSPAENFPRRSPPANSKLLVKVKVTLRLTVSQSVSLGIEPHLGLATRYSLFFYSYGLILWGALSDERTGLSFVYASGSCQRSLCRVRVPWDSRLYFTVSNLRLPFSSPPTTRRTTVEVFDPASTPVIFVTDVI
jgi:hypothetical protein